jgi:hypothetical protein
MVDLLGRMDNAGYLAKLRPRKRNYMKIGEMAGRIMSSH